MGFLFGNWATMIPYIKYKFDLTDSTLGLVLLSMPIGCLASNYLAALAVKQFGMREVTTLSMILLSLCYIIPFVSNLLIFVPIGLVLAGISVSLLNIAMNMTASELEKSARIYIMSTCHGMFSLGLMLGSMMRGFTEMYQLSASTHMFMMCGLTIICALSVGRTILNIKIVPAVAQEDQEKMKLTLPKGALLVMVIISLCTNMTEGCMAEWATLYMRDIVHCLDGELGLGLTAYSGLMAAGRFTGDSLIPRYGKNNILSWGALISCCGFVLAILFPTLLVVVIGFGMIGLGVSLGSPILYASAARYPDIPNSGGLAIMNTFSMAGFLISPVFIGFISDWSNLAAAFGVVAMLNLVWWYKSRTAILY
jgi:MFS family permease